MVLRSAKKALERLPCSCHFSQLYVRLKKGRRGERDSRNHAALERASSTSSGKTIGIGIGAAAGAAVGVALLVRHRHHSADKTETYVTGCTQSIQDGINLTDEKDNQIYSIVTNSKSLKAGERITLKGVLVASDGPGNPTFQMRRVIKDYGTCGTASASDSSAANPTSLN